MGSDLSLGELSVRALNVGGIIIFLEPVADLGAGNRVPDVREQFNHLVIIQIKDEADTAH